MTKKDYVAIAKIISDNSYEDVDNYSDELYINCYLSAIIDDLCTYFKHNNSSFNEDKFKEACGL